MRIQIIGQVAAQEQMGIIGQYIDNILAGYKGGHYTYMNINRYILELRILLAHSVSEKEKLELTDRLKEAQQVKEMLKASENRIA